MSQRGHSPPLPSVPSSSPSCPISYNARPVFPPLAAAPPPWQSVNKSPAPGHAPPRLGRRFPFSLLLLRLEDRPYSLSPAHLGSPPGYPRHWPRPLRGWLSGGPAHACPAQLARGPRQGAQRTPPAAGGRVSPTPLLPHAPAIPSPLRLRSGPAGPRPPDSGRGRGSPMAAAGSRRPSV